MTPYASPASWYKERNEKIYEQSMSGMSYKQIAKHWDFDSENAVRKIVSIQQNVILLNRLVSII